mmetsp:Transcript_31604/g.46031  ORF Transcript_31604/g.46031 Transcript_31604/m.46031 type:complete len:85 (+) Transcript_31604:1365-1619(+)
MRMRMICCFFLGRTQQTRRRQERHHTTDSQSLLPPPPIATTVTTPNAASTNPFSNKDLHELWDKKRYDESAISVEGASTLGGWV